MCQFLVKVTFQVMVLNLNSITKQDDLFVADFPSMVMLHQEFFSVLIIIAGIVQASYCFESLVMILL